MKLNRIISFLVISILLTACSGGLTANKDDIIFEIKKGESIHGIAKRLKSEKIIENPSGFIIIAKLLGKSNMKVGIYQIKKGEKYTDLIDKFSKCLTFSTKITIPEGYNIYQIADMLDKKGVADKDEFIAQCTNKELLKQLGISSCPSVEGYLYPDTYSIPQDYDSRKIIELAFRQFNKEINEEVILQIKKKGLNLKKVLIIASIVEREARQEFEKPIIAGVYYNRIKKGMKLQADPTLIYALIMSGTYDGNIRYRDFDNTLKYNTYMYYSLPPGPIANPCKTSILAAVNPAEVEYLYFVAKPDGTHQFSKTLEEHNKAVYIYQKLPAIERRKKKMAENNNV